MQKQKLRNRVNCQVIGVWHWSESQGEDVKVTKLSQVVHGPMPGKIRFKAGDQEFERGLSCTLGASGVHSQSFKGMFDLGPEGRFDALIEFYQDFDTPGSKLVVDLILTRINPRPEPPPRRV